MGQCLRGKMTEAGLLPSPATALVEPAAPVEEPAAVTPEPETAIADPALDVAPAQPAATVPENLIAATFGLLRAEPDGSVVIAGSGTPGTEVEVYSNGSLLGKATVETSGDWVLVPDAPIPPGGTELTLGEAGKEGRSAQSFVVAINEDKSSEPLVVASTPGAASAVLQGLDRPAAETPTQIATADPVEPPPATPLDAAAPVIEATPDAEPAADVPVATPSSGGPAPTEQTDIPAPEPAEADVPPVVAQPETAASAPAAPTTQTTPAAASADPVVVPEPATKPAELAPAPADPVAPTETAVAAAEPPAATPAAPVAVLDGTPPTIDAIELDGDRTFFAGGGPEGATMRLYVDDTFIADAEVTDGRWLVEADKVLDQPSQRVRIDMLQPGSAKVASRAEVNFVVELPAVDPTIAVAEAETPTTPEPAAPAPVPVASTPAPAPAAEPVPAAVPATAPTPAPADATPPAPADKTAQSSPAADEPTAPTTDDKATAPDPATLSAPADPAPSATAEPTVPVEQLAAPVTAQPVPEPPVAEPAPVPEPVAAPAPAIVTDTVPTMVAVSIGDPEAQRFASGKAIIRRGDNLWTIARRVYGEGIKFTTIYQANTGQIRDPDRIYPGQVFELPEGTN